MTINCKLILCAFPFPLLRTVFMKMDANVKTLEKKNKPKTQPPSNSDPQGIPIIAYSYFHNSIH